ncbi:MAG: TraB/GumN family protein [Xanthomonadaceae bacterium]|nr:TraB/GumN family protein [Xanthomonadaceae bacterium]
MWRILSRPLFATRLVMLLCLVSLHAQAQVFYTVTAPNGEINWLLGTVHSEDQRLLDFPPVLDQALTRADRLVLELVPDQEMLAALDRATRLPDGERLEARIGPDLYRRVASILGGRGLDRQSIQSMQPWAVAVSLAVPQPETGLFMDLALASIAAGQGAELVALETLEEQLGFVVALGQQAHIKMLEAALVDLEQGRSSFEDLIEAYRAGDLDGLQKLAERDLAGLGPDTRWQFKSAGIVDRNKKMADRVQALLDQGGSVVAVGALHLPGPEGLIALLREQGNRVDAIY